MKLFQSGACEPTKATVHAALGLLALTCAGYNLTAWLLRREKHLAVNTVIYSAIVVLEVQQVRRHWDRCTPSANGR